jgi:hypothetical protein
MAKRKEIKVEGTSSAPPVGILIEGSKASAETMTRSIVTVLDTVSSHGMSNEVAISALEVLEAVAENPANTTVRDCDFNITSSDK